MITSAVSLRHVTKAFCAGTSRLVVLDDISLDFERNALTAVLGPSGCGKTTLLRLVAGLDRPTSGSIETDPDIQRIGMVFQEYSAFDWLTVEGNIRFGLRLNGTPRSKQSEVVTFWLERTGLAEFRRKYPTQLSGGMRQRLAFARCLAAQPALVLLDEPFGALDALTREQIGRFAFDVLRGYTAILVTHSVVEAVALASRIVVLSRRPARVLLDQRTRPASSHHALATPSAAIAEALALAVYGGDRSEEPANGEAE